MFLLLYDHGKYKQLPHPVSHLQSLKYSQKVCQAQYIYVGY